MLPFFRARCFTEALADETDVGLRREPRLFRLAVANRVTDRQVLRHQLPGRFRADCHLAEVPPHLFVQQAQNAGYQMTKEDVVRRFGDRQVKRDVGSHLGTSVIAQVGRIQAGKSLLDA